jgi:hypothetical protein
MLSRMSLNLPKVTATSSGVRDTLKADSGSHCGILNNRVEKHAGNSFVFDWP